MGRFDLLVYFSVIGMAISTIGCLIAFFIGNLTWTLISSCGVILSLTLMESIRRSNK